MKRFLFIAINFITGISTTAQKPAIDYSALDTWKSVDVATISNDGKYVFFQIVQGTGAGPSLETMVVRATGGNWKMELPGARNVNFSPDSRQLLFTKAGDGLGMLDLGSSLIQYIPQVSSYKLPAKSAGRWLAYELNNHGKQLVLRNLATGKEKVFSSIEKYWFGEDGRSLILQAALTKEDKTAQSLQWLNLANGNLITIWEGAGVNHLVFDGSGTQLAFSAPGETGGTSRHPIWHYKVGMNKAVRLINNEMPAVEEGWELAGIEKFIQNGNSILFAIRKKEQPQTPSPHAVQLNVWSYQDDKLQSEQLREATEDWRPSFLSVIHLSDNGVIRMGGENENVIGPFGDIVFIDHHEGAWGGGEERWNKNCSSAVYVLSLQNGQRVRVPALDKRLDAFSPDGKYMVYFDGEQKDYFSYEAATGIVRNITNGMAATWYNLYDNWLNADKNGRGIAAWVKEDGSVLLYDSYDIWWADPSGKRKAVNITNGYGRQHHIIFDITGRWIENNPVSTADPLILTAFNFDNKDNGFYKKMITRPGNPELLTMGPYLFEVPAHGGLPDGAGYRPIKAANANAYIVRREKASESPNYFFTTDFKSFTPLSDVYPERQFNWLATELHQWKASDGKTIQGILFKPENFDPGKKYPVIFNYYLRKSEGLHAFIKPDFLTAGCNMNISWYVSNGYLVFLPDIHVTRADVGPCAENAVVSAAQYLSTLNFVDAKKLGLQGCSGGGYETNYLVTHSDLFAAACSSSGISNFISGYGSLGGRRDLLAGMYELGWWRVGASIWEKPDTYIKYSPIFKADKVTTPLLMFHTSFDGVCPFPQAVELFTALRRLGKRAWMLEYKDGDHGVWGRPATDFSIRMAQFFDHYLKDKPAPRWMTRGIPAKLKGVETGLEPDNAIETPGPGLLVQEQP